MTKPLLSLTDNLVEALAKIEHQQWMHWSQAVASQVSPTVRGKWKASWMDYNKLTDDVKEADRVWARKVVTLLRRRGLTKQ
jgi:hypothetical protein